VGAAVFWAAWVSGPAGATVLFGVVSFLALREYVTLVKTRRGDHRSLLLAFFGVLPLQYVLVANRNFDLFSVFIPVYVFLAIPVVSALAGDPQRFLERNAKIQWGIMVCVYGLSHAPALVLLDFPGHRGRGAFAEGSARAASLLATRRLSAARSCGGSSCTAARPAASASRHGATRRLCVHAADTTGPRIRGRIGRRVGRL
jgi:hypothetical protein